MEANTVCLQDFLLHIMLCGFPMENIWLERRNWTGCRIFCVKPPECKEFGSLVCSHSSMFTFQKESIRKERLFVMSWGYYLLYPLFTVAGYDTALCYGKGHFSLFTGRKMEGEGRNRGRKGSECSYQVKLPVHWQQCCLSTSFCWEQSKGRHSFILFSGMGFVSNVTILQWW